MFCAYHRLLHERVVRIIPTGASMREIDRISGHRAEARHTAIGFQSLHVAGDAGFPPTFVTRGIALPNASI